MSAAGQSLVQWELAGRVAWLTLARPAKRNALSAELRNALLAALSRAEADPQAEIVVLNGSGGVFCAGADVEELRAGAAGGTVQQTIAANEALRDRWASLAKPTIAAVDGAAFGLGFVLAFRSDFVLATEQARFCLPEASLGLSLPSGAEIYFRRFGAQRANELLMACRVLSALDALSWGLVNQVAADMPAMREAVAALANDVLRTPAALRLQTRTAGGRL